VEGEASLPAVMAMMTGFIVSSLDTSPYPPPDLYHSCLHTVSSKSFRFSLSYAVSLLAVLLVLGNTVAPGTTA
jgi:hypothetical protein